MRTSRVFGKLFRSTTHTFAIAFILILPLGYYAPEDDSTDVLVGVHGGAGQVAAVIRDCNDNPIASGSNEFVELSGSASIKVAEIENTDVLLSLSGGYWSVPDVVVPDAFPTGDPSTDGGDLSEAYANVQLSFEGPVIGFGAGAIFGDLPIMLSDLYDGNYPQGDKVKVSGHLRIGRVNKFHFLVQLAERRPMLSNGLLQIGFGYPISDRVHMYSALSALWYDRAGFVQAGRFAVSPRLSIDAALRLGQAADHFEGSISGGLTYGFGFRK